METPVETEIDIKPEWADFHKEVMSRQVRVYNIKYNIQCVRW